MSQGSVRVCGERGLLVFCPKCEDWEPFEHGSRSRSTPPGGTIYSFGAWCSTCRERLPKVEPLKRRQDPEVNSADEEEADHG